MGIMYYSNEVRIYHERAMFMNFKTDAPYSTLRESYAILELTSAKYNKTYLAVNGS